MNKIINWLFGSFFRTLGRILVYILIALILSYALKDVKLPKFDISSFLFMDVHAENTDVWFDNIENYGITPFYWYNHNSSGYSEITSSTDYRSLYFNNTDINDEPIIRTYSLATTQDYVNIANNGVSVSYFIKQTLAQHYLYSLTTYVCSYEGIGSTTASLTTGYNATNAIDHSMTYTNTTKTFLYNVSGSNSQDTLRNCYAIVSMFSPNGNYQWVNLKLTNSSNINTKLFVVGYDIKELGIYDSFVQSTISNAISNSGLASASSISQVQNSINQVQSSLNTDTTNIINNQNSNKNEIISNANTNSQNEIENANANTDKTIDSQKVCKLYDNNSILEENKYLEQNGNSYGNVGFGVSDYISIDSNSSIIPTVIYDNQNVSYCYYNINKTLISCSRLNTLILNQELTIPNNSSYFRFTINKSLNKPQFKICKNGNQAMSDSLNDMNSYLTDDSAPNSDISSLGTVQGLLPAGPVDSLLNIPMTFLSVITSSMGGQCVPLEGNFIFDSTLSIPCFSSIIYDNNSFPPALMVFINLIPSAFILIMYFKHLYKKVDRATSLDSNADDEWGVI